MSWKKPLALWARARGAEPFGLVKGLGNPFERERVRNQPLERKAFEVAPHKGQGLWNSPGRVVRGGNETRIATHERGGIIREGVAWCDMAHFKVTPATA